MKYNNSSKKSQKKPVPGKLKNRRKREFVLAVKTIKSFSDDEIGDFVGVTRQTVGNHFRDEQQQKEAQNEN